MVFKKGDRGVGYYEDPLAPRVLMPTEPPAEPDSEAGAADDSDTVLERLKAKLRQDVDAAADVAEPSPIDALAEAFRSAASPVLVSDAAAAPPADDAPGPEEPSEAAFLRALADADAAADAAAPTEAAEPSPIDALAAAFASTASPSLVTAPGSALRVTTDDADDLPDSEVRLRAAEDAAEDALSKFDAAPLTGNYRGKAEAFRSALAAAEAELDEALATARSSTSGAPADGPDTDDALAED